MYPIRCIAFGRPRSEPVRALEAHYKDLLKACARLDTALRIVGFPKGDGPPGARHGNSSDVGFAGSLVFHLGLLVTLVGVGASSRGRFNGELVVTEGVPFVFAPGN